MKRHMRIRVTEVLASTLHDLQASTGLPHSRFIRSILLGRPILPASNLRLWQKLARTKANLTQLEALIEEAPSSVHRRRLLKTLDLAKEDLRLLRRALLGSS